MGKTVRLTSIDMLRGLVIALMALDHTRDFFGFATFNPEDLAATTPGWFWTRWITHLCAPVFVLLAGSSAYLRGQSSGVQALSRYLLTRGAMLLVLEATWISFSWQFGFDVIILQVIWAIGMGMMALAGLVWLPRWAIALIAALLIVPHNLLDSVNLPGFLWLAWHKQGFFPLPAWTKLQGIMVMYPLMPWLGMMAAGYALGPVFQWEAARRQRFLLLASALLMLGFVALRYFNVYGDNQPWSPQGHGAMFDFMAFMRVQKYPPSLLYLCVTGSIGLALLALFERLRDVKLLLLFGRHPMFFYVIHIALIHFLAGVWLIAQFGHLPDFSNGNVKMPDGFVASLVTVYTAWVVMLAIMAGLITLWVRLRKR